MSKVYMKQFGRTLTDRNDGRKTFDEISKKYESPIDLDFQGVMSMGSSFGDEVLVEIAKKQSNKILVFNTNDAIKNCIYLVIEGLPIEVIFLNSRSE